MPIAILTMAPTVEQMQLVTFPNVDQDILEMMDRELHFYLHELKNPDPQSYLIYHGNVLANVYTNIHTSFVERIDFHNFGHFIYSQSKIHGCYYNSMASGLFENFTSIVSHYLNLKANNDPWVEQVHTVKFDQNLRLLHRIFFTKLKDRYGLELPPFNGIQLAKYICDSDMDLEVFCNMLNLFYSDNIIKFKHLKELLLFKYVAKVEIDKLVESA
jgi:hypothetical protein